MANHMTLALCSWPSWPLKSSLLSGSRVDLVCAFRCATSFPITTCTPHGNLAWTHACSREPAWRVGSQPPPRGTRRNSSCDVYAFETRDEKPNDTGYRAKQDIMIVLKKKQTLVHGTWRAPEVHNMPCERLPLEDKKTNRYGTFIKALKAVMATDVRF